VRRAAVLVFVVVLVAACGSSDGASASSCKAVEPERVVDSPLEVEDLSVTVPKGSLDLDGDGAVDDVKVDGGEISVNDLVLTTSAPSGLSIRTWADLDGDGDDDLLVDDGKLWLVKGGSFRGQHAITDIGVHVDDRFTTMWPASLDTTPGGDFYIVRDEDGHTVTDAYSGMGMLRGANRVASTRLDGAPRTLARLEKGGPLETVLLDAGPPSRLTFAPTGRSPLRADLGESHRVTWVRVFEEKGTRKIALQVDRNVAVWTVPPFCSD
jgi:hypothetical protein